MPKNGRFAGVTRDGLAACLLSALTGCAGEPEASETEVQQGRALFESGALSDSSLNVYACSTCHEAEPTGSSRIFPGAALAGATLRGSYWGGQENDLLRSLDACRNYFMYAAEPLDPESAEGRSLYAFLVSLAPGNSEAVPFSVVGAIEPLPRGDAVRGAELFDRACKTCHGTLHEGAGALHRVPPLPEATLLDHADYAPREQRLVFIEKVRHGAFLGYGGSMAPFSREALGDPELSDILEALGVLGE
jgi:thiosulfate dehydrogenase